MRTRGGGAATKPRRFARSSWLVLLDQRLVNYAGKHGAGNRRQPESSQKLHR
jgi:hypothetical protein